MVAFLGPHISQLLAFPLDDPDRSPRAPQMPLKPVLMGLLRDQPLALRLGSDTVFIAYRQKKRAVLDARPTQCQCRSRHPQSGFPPRYSGAPCGPAPGPTTSAPGRLSIFRSEAPPCWRPSVARLS